MTSAEIVAMEVRAVTALAVCSVGGSLSREVASTEAWELGAHAAVAMAMEAAATAVTAS